MASSERLDGLVARARTLFESKHGHSEGCFAAYSPAKINLMGDAIEGSGGLTLQIALDRRVLLFGRGRVLPERHFPLGVKRITQPPHQPFSRMAVVEEDGREWDDEASGGGNDGGIDSASKPRSKWSVPQRTKNAGRTVDSMVQDLVFGRKTRSKSVHSLDKGGDVTARWLKNGEARFAALRGKGGEGKGAGGVGGETGGSFISMATPHDASGQNGHGNGRWSAPITMASGSQPGRTFVWDGSGDHTGSDDVTPLSTEPHKLSSSREESSGLHSHDGSSATTTTSGSTTTEEGFPIESGHGNSGSTFENGRRSGGGGGGGGNGSFRSGGGDDDEDSRRRGSIESAVTDPEASSQHGDSGGDVPKEDEHWGHGTPATRLNGVLGVAEVAAVDLSATKEAARGARMGVPARRAALEPSPSGLPPSQVGLSLEQSPPAVSPSWGVRGENRRPHGHSLIGAWPPSPPPSRLGSEEGAVSSRNDQEQGGVDGLENDPALARALEEVAQAKAEIKAAEVAEMEAERIRTSRIYCEACPDDGMVEFVATKGMRGGGTSWKGLVTAVAAEYVHELPRGMLVGLEAVVVSDLPGSVGHVSIPGDVWQTDSAKQQGGGIGYGWSGAARCALLMASATFLENVLGMERFPRMKAMRCFSASLRCGRPSGAAREKQPGGAGLMGDDGGGSSSSVKRKGAGAPALFSLDEVFRSHGTRVDEAATSESPGGVSLEDLLVIAMDDPPGVQVVDSKWRTCWHVPMAGPSSAGLAIVVAQPLSVETARRLRSQAEQERERGSSTCHAVVGVARERHPDAIFLRDVPPETLDALVPVGASRVQQKKAAAMAAAAAAAAGGGGVAGGRAPAASGTVESYYSQGVDGSTAGSWTSGHRRPYQSEGGGGGGPATNGRLSTEVLAHARHLVADMQRVADVAGAVAVGDMETVGKLMMQSRRSAGLATTGSRGRQDPAEPEALKLASMMSRLPGVHGSGLSEGPGSGAMGAVVALVDPSMAEGVLRAVSTRGKVDTGVAWGGFATRVGGGSGVIRTAV